MTPEDDVLVVGAGICGLTSALALAETGLRVTVEAAAPPELTTSAVAGAIWGPHLVGLDHRGAGWAQRTLARLRELAAAPDAKIRMLAGTDAYTREQPEPPDWTDGVGERVPCDPATLPAGYRAGWRFTAPVAWMPGYLAYLTSQLRQAGVPVIADRPYASLAEAARQAAAPVIVNCTGIGACDLVPDPAMTPVRGQVIVATNPGITEFFVGHGPQPDDVTYLFPHQDTIVLGGTGQPGDWSQEPDPDTAKDILDRCVAVDPRLLGVTVLAHRVGLRPLRPMVRLEGEPMGDRYVVHNYGHGGAGVTLAWGCAEEVAELVRRQLS